jgi:pSer/pThr/pTyr-binding forkhead associated (FHA) protein
LKFTLESGESKLFSSLPISLGRADNNDIILPDETVSAQHAQIYYDEKVNDICIVDLDSLNGLFIGDQPTHRNVLYDGVKIGLGAATLIFAILVLFIRVSQPQEQDPLHDHLPRLRYRKPTGAKFCKAVLRACYHHCRYTSC